MPFSVFAQLLNTKRWVCFCLLLAACAGDRDAVSEQGRAPQIEVPPAQAHSDAKTPREPIWLTDLSEGTKPRVAVAESTNGLHAAQPPAGYDRIIHRQGQDQGRSPLIALGTKLSPMFLDAGDSTSPEPALVAPAVAVVPEIAKVSSPKKPVSPHQSSPAQSERGTFLQLASLRGEDAAFAAGRSLKADFSRILSDYDFTLQPVEISGRGTFQRVRFGPFASRQEANAACEALKSRGQDCIRVTADLATTEGSTEAPESPKVREVPVEPKGQSQSVQSSEAQQAQVTSGPYLQLISIRDEQKALAAGARLKAEYAELLDTYQFNLQPVAIDGRGVFQRVRFGPFASFDTARDTCGDLKARGQDCLVVAR